MTEHSDSNNPTIDVVFDLLADQRRRSILTCLMDQTQAIALTELAEDVAVRENEGTLTEIPKETIRTISTSLYHIHLPKLAEAGVVEHDWDCDQIQVSKSVDLVEHVLSLVADGEEEQ